MQRISNGIAYGIDHIKELIKLSTDNVKKSNSELLREGKVKFFVKDGRKGLPEFAPYDCIHVGAGIHYTIISI